MTLMLKEIENENFYLKHCMSLRTFTHVIIMKLLYIGSLLPLNRRMC